MSECVCLNCARVNVCRRTWYGVRMHTFTNTQAWIFLVHTRCFSCHKVVPLLVESTDSLRVTDLWWMHRKNPPHLYKRCVIFNTAISQTCVNCITCWHSNTYSTCVENETHCLTVIRSFSSIQSLTNQWKGEQPESWGRRQLFGMESPPKDIHQTNT